MRIRYTLCIALAAMVLAGCQKEPAASAPSATPAPADGSAQAAPGKLTQAEAFTEALPGGIVLDFPYHARSVKTVTSRKSGRKSRQYLMEYLGSNPKSAAGAVSADMVRAGFTAAGKKKKKNGYNLAFTRDGYGKVRVYVRKASQKKLRHAEAKGLIKISFPEASPPPAAQPSA